MDDEVKKSLDDLDSAADELLEKSQKSKKDVKKSKEKDDDVKEKPAEQDHDADGADVSEKDSKVVSDDKDDKGDHTITHNIDKAKCDKDVEKSKDAKKSISADLKDNEELKKSMQDNNAAFLTMFTQVQAQALDRLDSKIEKSLGAKDGFVKSVSKAVTTLVKSNESLFDLVKSQDEKIKGLEDTVGKISHEPQVRKSVQGVQAIEKSFNTPAGLKGNENLSKSQVMQKLTGACIDKSDGNPVTMQDVASYEHTGDIRLMRPEVKSYIENQFNVKAD